MWGKVGKSGENFSQNPNFSKEISLEIAGCYFAGQPF
jgi:hypothetical protein